jgi:prefoldin subunit 5
MLAKTEQVLEGIGHRLMALMPGKGKLAAASPIDDVDGNLALLSQRAESLRAKARALKARIDSLLAQLNRPKEVADGLRSLSGDLGTLSTLLRVVSVVRIIRPAADMLRRQVDILKAPVDAAEGKAQGVVRALEPLRAALGKLSKTIGDLVTRLDQVIAQSGKAREKVRTVRSCMQALPAGPVRDRGFQLLDDFARTANPVLRTAADALQAADSAAGAVEREMAMLEGQLEELRRTVLGGIQAVRSVFGPVLGPLRDLQSALDYRIDLGLFSFSLRQILDGISLPWPFSYLEEQFWNIANGILQPILRALHLDISLPSIPGLDLLDRIRPDLPSIHALEPAIDGATRLAGNAQNLVDRFDVHCPPKAEQVLFSERLLADLAEVEPQLVREG